MLIADVPASERQDLLIKKLYQCCIIFDFTDNMSEMKGKEVKRQTLSELVEYISTSRGVITEIIYPEVVKMASLNSNLMRKSNV